MDSLDFLRRREPGTSIGPVSGAVPGRTVTSSSRIWKAAEVLNIQSRAKIRITHSEG
jgi:hypothetical protein